MSEYKDSPLSTTPYKALFGLCKSLAGLTGEDANTLFDQKVGHYIGLAINKTTNQGYKTQSSAGCTNTQKAAIKKIVLSILKECQGLSWAGLSSMNDHQTFLNAFNQRVGWLKPENGYIGGFKRGKHDWSRRRFGRALMFNKLLHNMLLQGYYELQKELKEKQAIYFDPQNNMYFKQQQQQQNQLNQQFGNLSLDEQKQGKVISSQQKKLQHEQYGILQQQQQQQPFVLEINNYNVIGNKVQQQPNDEEPIYANPQPLVQQQPAPIYTQPSAPEQPLPSNELGGDQYIFNENDFNNNNTTTQQQQQESIYFNDDNNDKNIYFNK